MSAAARRPFALSLTLFRNVRPVAATLMNVSSRLGRCTDRAIILAFWVVWRSDANIPGAGGYRILVRPCADNVRSSGRTKDCWKWHRRISLGLWYSLDSHTNFPGCALEAGCDVTDEPKTLFHRTVCRRARLDRSSLFDLEQSDRSMLFDLSRGKTPPWTVLALQTIPLSKVERYVERRRPSQPGEAKHTATPGHYRSTQRA